MSLSATSYSYDLRVLQCPSCGAPITCPWDGGQVACAYCRTVTLVTRRPEAPAWNDGPAPVRAEAHSPEDDEKARIDALSAQLAPGAPQSPYAPESAPADLRTRMSKVTKRAKAFADEQWRTLRAEWHATHACDQARAYWVGGALAADAQAKGDHLGARAALETTLEMVTDEGYRLLLYSRLVRNAAALGDVAAAKAWLGQCNPRPRDVVLETALRSAQAAVLTAERDYVGVLGILGEKHSAPLFPDAIACYEFRVNALEMLGREDAAFEELRNSYVPVGNASVLWWLRIDGLAPKTVARGMVRIRWIRFGLGVFVLAVGAYVLRTCGVFHSKLVRF